MAEIKISELSIGDWVRYKSWVSVPMKVLEIGEKYGISEEGEIYITGETNVSKLGGLFCEVDDIEPIPLTPEILEQNGFVRWEKKYGDMVYELHIKQGELRYRLHYMEFENNHHRARNLKRQMLHFSIEESTNGNRIGIKRNQGKPLYLHELQHLLRLVGVEKEIEM